MRRSNGEARASHDWYFITHLGNSALLLPLALAIGVGLWAGGRGRLAARWLGCFAAAALLVAATNIAFTGWGIGIRRLDFIGISGHSTLAAAVLPMLGWWLAQSARRTVHLLGLAAGLGLALGLGVVWWVVPRGARALRGGYLAWAVALGFLLAGLIPFDHDFAGAHGLIVKLALHLSADQV